MDRVIQSTEDRPSLEALVESGVVELETLHPGGLILTSELASLCGITAGTKVLDVACGTGESACYLAEQHQATVCGVDQSERLLARAREKAKASDLNVQFRKGDAEALPFSDAEFDVVVCECTLCLLDKTATLKEMVRVARPGGRVGAHDLAWRENAPDLLKRRLAEYEDEYPETLEGWKQLFAGVGLANVIAFDKSRLKNRWMCDVRRQLGISGQLRLGLYAGRRWGLGGLWRILRSERIFSHHQLGYALVVGTRA